MNARDRSESDGKASGKVKPTYCFTFAANKILAYGGNAWASDCCSNAVEHIASKMDEQHVSFALTSSIESDGRKWVAT